MPPYIKGKVSAFSYVVSAGNILGEDGNTYLFSQKDWRSVKEPDVGTDVVFLCEGGRARSVITEEEQ